MDSRVRGNDVSPTLEQIIQIIPADAASGQLAVFLKVLLNKFAFPLGEHRVFFERKEDGAARTLQLLGQGLAQILLGLLQIARGLPQNAEIVQVRRDLRVILADKPGRR